MLTRAGEIAHVTLATTLVELGSGSSEKTRLLIDALRGEESLRQFMPFDVCLPFVRDAAGALSRDYPGLDVHAIVGDFHKHVRFLPRRSTAGAVTPASISPLSMRRLIATRNWHPPDERGRIDGIVRAARAGQAVPRGTPL